MVQPVFSIIAPVYNEHETLPELHRRMHAVMDALGEEWELVLVDDGSQDGSGELIRKLAVEDPRVRPVIFARNFGHQLAVTAGMDHSRGQAVVVIDADLQDPPEVIPELIAKWREGYEVVYAVREAREGESRFKLWTASLFYRFIHAVAEVDIPLDAGDFRLLDRKVVDVLGEMREHNRFLRGMSAWVGFRQVGVPYQRAARFAGESKYPLRKMIQLALNGIIGFSFFPLRLVAMVGLGFTGLSVLAFIVMLILHIVGTAGAWGLDAILLAIFFVGGVQLVALGMLGEYLGRTYDEARGRPLYILREGPDDAKNPNNELSKEH